MLTASMTIHKDQEQGFSPLRSSWELRQFFVSLPRRAGQPKGEDMNALTFVRQNAQAIKKSSATSRRRLEIAQSLGAVFGLVGGILAGLFGSFFTAASWFGANEGLR